MAEKVLIIGVDELQALVKRAVREALDEREPDAELLLTTAECAELLGVHEKTVGQYVRRHGLPAVRAGQSYRFRRSEVIAWLEERSTQRGAHTEKAGRKLQALKGRK